MQRLIYILFLAIFLTEFLSRSGAAPRVINYIPEILSGIAFVIVIIQAARQRYAHIRVIYWILFFFIVLHIIFGLVLNSTPTTVIFAGIRTYFKYIPLFLVPLVFTFTNEQIKKQLKLLLFLAIIQLPIAVYQRMTTNKYTGDYVMGTLDGSGMLTIFMMCCITVLMAFYIRKQIQTKHFLLFLALLFLPTTINETKITIILLPLALMIPVFFSTTGSQRVKRLIGSSIAGVICLAIFIPVYDTFMAPRWGYGLLDFLTMEGRLSGYLSKSERKLELGHVGRVDAVVFPVQMLAEDPSKMLLGLGIANVSHSKLGDKFIGEYYDDYGHLIDSSLSTLMWEIGLLGVFLLLLLFYLVFKDALRLRMSEEIIGLVALAWLSILCIYLLALFYGKIIPSNALSFLFWYFSGLIAAASARLPNTKRKYHRVGN